LLEAGQWQHGRRDFLGKKTHLSLFTREVGFTQVKIRGKDKTVSPLEIYLTWFLYFSLSLTICKVGIIMQTCCEAKI